MDSPCGLDNFDKNLKAENDQTENDTSISKIQVSQPTGNDARHDERGDTEYIVHQESSKSPQNKPVTRQETALVSRTEQNQGPSPRAASLDQNFLASTSPWTPQLPAEGRIKLPTSVNSSEKFGSTSTGGKNAESKKRDDQKSNLNREMQQASEPQDEKIGSHSDNPIIFGSGLPTIDIAVVVGNDDEKTGWPWRRAPRPEKRIPESRLGDLNESTESSHTESGGHRTVLTENPGEDVNRPRVSDDQRSINHEEAGRGHKNAAWVTDRTMFAQSFNEARIIVFYCDKIRANAVTSSINNPDEEAKRFFEILVESRASDHFGKVPLVLIGMGSGRFIIQKLFNLVSSEPEDTKSRTSMGSMVSTIVLLGTPARVRNEQSDKSLPTTWSLSPFGPEASDNWTNSFKRIHNRRETWTKFYREAERRHLPVVWFGQPSFEELFLGGESITIFSFEDSLEQPTRVVPRIFQGPQDRNYLKLVDKIQTDLLFKAIEENLPEGLLTMLISGECSLSTGDHKPRQPLHKAASCARDKAVSLIVSKDPSIAGNVDNEGSTALHCAIKNAAKCDPKNDDRSKFKSIILCLVAALEEAPGLDDKINIRDSDGKSAWEYATSDENQWIRELSGYFVSTGKKATTSTRTAPGNFELEVPTDTDKINACQESYATIAQFYANMNSGEDSFFKKQHSIYSLLYEHNPPRTIDQLFEELSSEGTKGTPTCRWIHLPENNEQWVHDTFSWLGRADESMNGKRHQGTAIYDRHMIAGAEKYEKMSQSKTIGGTQQPLTGGESPDVGPSHRGKGKEVEHQEMTMFSRKKDTFSLFMPILGFEQHQYRKKLTNAMKSIQNSKMEDLSHKNLLPMRAYFQEKTAPLHCRRTLDQFTYFILQDTEQRDNDQVIFKWVKRNSRSQQSPSRDPAKEETPPEDQYPVLMVDQLWIWVLEDERIVLTSFPNAWDSSKGYNLLQQILRGKARKNDRRPVINSAMSLANLILGCGVDFLRRKGPKDVSLKECFQSSITEIVVKQSDQYKDFKILVQDLIKRSQAGQKDNASNTDGLFRLTEESHLLASIMDIQDELKSIKDVFKKQREVLKRFNDLAKKTHEDNLRIVDSNIATIGEMEKYARKVHTEIKGLLSLKQKQANAWEARFAREGSEHTQRQSNITLVFTIVTIIFLPLSFMSSILAIQVHSYPREATSNEISWPIGEFLGLLLGVSFIVIIPSIIVAFRVNQIFEFFKKMQKVGNNDTTEITGALDSLIDSPRRDARLEEFPPWSRIDQGMGQHEDDQLSNPQGSSIESPTDDDRSFHSPPNQNWLTFMAASKFKKRNSVKPDVERGMLGASSSSYRETPNLKPRQRHPSFSRDAESA